MIKIFTYVCIEDIFLALKNLALLVVRRGLAPKNKKLKIEEKIFFDFAEKKETRRKGINTSQLAVRNFNDITRKHINIPCVFYFYVFSLKTKIFQTYFCIKQTLLPVIKLTKTCVFPVQNVFNVCSVRNHFFVK